MVGHVAAAALSLSRAEEHDFACGRVQPESGHVLGPQPLIEREPRPWWVTRLLQLSACLGLKSIISRAVGVSSLLGVSQGHGGSRGSSKVAMSSPENSAEGAKGYIGPPNKYRK